MYLTPSPHSRSDPLTREVNSEIEYIQPKSLVSTALIFNELITNSLKHGFTNIAKGQILMNIKSPKEDIITFDYHDNGIWQEPKSSETFGLELIESLADQLDGHFKRDISNGTHYHFEFNYENNKKY